MLDRSNAVQVDYMPNAELINQYVHMLNEKAGLYQPQEMAALMASTVAACAYMMAQSNEPETIKRVFAGLVEQACKQFDLRAKQIAKQKADRSSIIRIKAND